ncbi:MAG: IclR family transcriptional regulator [Alphaproteobacteria bacterium]|nr:IclR family transcriptional regulator [Alphaproteobacteria bacterium]
MNEPVSPTHAHPRKARIQSIARANAIIEVLAMADGGWVALRDIAARTGLVKTTAFNLVTALVDVDMVEHDAASGAYRLGLQFLVYGRAVERRTDLVGWMRPYLMRLCMATRETVNLALPCPTDVLIVDSIEGSQSLRVTSYSGTRAFYHSTACGRALLAWRPPAVRSQILTLAPLTQLTPHTTVDPAKIEAILAECLLNGFATEVEENELGAACVGAPVRDASGEAIAAVSVAGPLARMTPDTRARIGAILVETLDDARRAMSARTGVRAP